MNATKQRQPGEHTRDPRLAAVIMAAGKGTRMPGDLPKVLHPVAGRPMVRWVVDAARAAGAGRIILIVGYRAEAVRAAFADDSDDEEAGRDIEYVVQSEQRGTGHAVQCAEETLKDFGGDVLVLAGDGPLIREETIRALVARHRSTGAAATLATSVIENPATYGRIVRDSAGRFEAIVEERVATPAQLEIREVNPSYYCFDARMLFDALRAVTPNAASGEWYLTDVPGILRQRGERVEVAEAVPAADVLSINTPAQLAEVDRILSSRLEACL